MSENTSPQSSLEKIKAEKKQLQREIRERMVASVLAALGLVIGLAWNDAIKSTIEYFSPTGSGILYKFVYALILTLLVGILAYYVSKFFVKPEPKP